MFAPHSPSLLSKLGRPLLSAAIAASAFVVSEFSRAETLYNNGAPHYAPTNGFEMTQWIQADDFTLVRAARVEQITFWDLEINGNFYGTIYWEIRGNSNNNTPGALLHSGEVGVFHSATGWTDGTYVEYINSFSIPPVVLPPGTFWLALHNGPKSNSIIQRVFWAYTGQRGDRTSYKDLGPVYAGIWDTNSQVNRPSELAFHISGVFAPRVDFRRESGQPLIRFSTASGYSYRVEYADHPAGQWNALPGGEVIFGDGDDMEINDPNAFDPRRLYRVVVL